MVRIAGRLGVFLEMIKFAHTLFALPFALAAAALAFKRGGEFRPWDLVGVVLCMATARTAAMGYNRWADRDVDADNPRTAGRAIPAGLLTPGQVLAITALSAAAFVASTTIFWATRGNPWPLAWSVPLLIFLAGYSHAKRFTAGAHLWLGAALAGSPVGVWIALLPPGEWWPPLLLGVAIGAWVTGFDIIYACQDLAFDRRRGLASVPARLGLSGALWVARACHAATVAALAAYVAVTPELRLFSPIAVAGVAILLLVEHLLVFRRDPETELGRVNLAFFHVNAIISLGMLVATLADLAR